MEELYKQWRVDNNTDCSKVTRQLAEDFVPVNDPTKQDTCESGALDDDDDPVDPRWKRLYDALVVTCKRFGDENAFGRADFWVVDDDYGDHNQKLCVTSLTFLTPEVALAIQQCIRETGLSGAQVMVQLELWRYGGDQVPPEGLIVKADEITEYWNLEQVRTIVGDNFYRSRAPGRPASRPA